MLSRGDWCLEVSLPVRLQLEAMYGLCIKGNVTLELLVGLAVPKAATELGGLVPQVLPVSEGECLLQ